MCTVDENIIGAPKCEIIFFQLSKWFIIIMDLSLWLRCRSFSFLKLLKISKRMRQKGIDLILNHDFYVVVGKLT